MAQVSYLTISAAYVGQRIDNYLVSHCKKVPKSRIYRALRTGEVRVNKGRIKPDYRLQLNDSVRLPPLHKEEASAKWSPGERLSASLEQCVLFEDEALLVLNKPSGLAVHAGSGVDHGIIEVIRSRQKTADDYVELVHRLDRDTSGCLLLAKQRQILLYLHELLRLGKVHKYYLLVVHGRWQCGDRTVDVPLLKNQPRSGERMVVVDTEGQHATTHFRLLCHLGEEHSLLCAMPATGRTHQIRVHAAYLGHPIVGDQKYGDSVRDREIRARGYNGLFLHAYHLSFAYPMGSMQLMTLTAPLHAAWEAVLQEEGMYCLAHLNF